MKYLKKFNELRIFESNFDFYKDTVDRELFEKVFELIIQSVQQGKKTISWDNKAAGNPGEPIWVEDYRSKLQSLIYRLIFRGDLSKKSTDMLRLGYGLGPSPNKPQHPLQAFCDKNKSNYGKLINHFEKYDKYGGDKTIRVVNDKGYWLNVKFNEEVKKTAIGDEYITFNRYITFEKTPQNLSNVSKGLDDLIKMFYKFVREYENSNGEKLKFSFKFLSEFDKFMTELDHLKFYWYNKDHQKLVDKLVNEWLTKHDIKTVKRPYEYGHDTKPVNPKHSNDGDSFGGIVSKKVADYMADLIEKNKASYKPSAYFDHMIQYIYTVRSKHTL